MSPNDGGVAFAIKDPCAESLKDGPLLLARRRSASTEVLSSRGREDAAKASAKAAEATQTKEGAKHGTKTTNGTAKQVTAPEIPHQKTWSGVKQPLQHCAEGFRCNLAMFEEPSFVVKERLVHQTIRTSGPHGFAADELTSQSTISFQEEAAVVVFFLLLLFGPLAFIAAVLTAAFSRAWRWFSLLLALWALLALHPLPPGPRSRFCRSDLARWFAVALFRYFSVRFLWTGEARKMFMEAPPSLAMCPPHGVLPVAGLLAIPAINVFAKWEAFVGTAATVVFRTPLLRYVTAFGAIDVGKSNLVRAISEGFTVGVVPDGIAGIFYTNEHDEVVPCLRRRGLARLALQLGVPIVPSYAMGNTEMMSAWFDPWGLMRGISSALRISLFMPVGRWGLPVPRRANMTMLFGPPVPVEKSPDPTEDEVDELHKRVLNEISELFEVHKDALGFGGKKLVFI